MAAEAELTPDSAPGPDASTELPMLTHQATDGELILRRANGDERAFEQLLGRYATSLHSYVLGIVRDWHLAKDVCQDVWVKVLEFSNLDEIDHFRAWLYRIAMHQAIDLCRARGRKHYAKPMADDCLGPLTGADQNSCDPQEAVEKNEELDALDDCLKKLDPLDYQILAMHYIAGLTYEDIATILGKPVSTVKTKAAKALGQLKQLLEGSTVFTQTRKRS